MEKGILSLEECRAIMNKEGVKYSDNELEEIRNSMYQLSIILYKLFEKEQMKEEGINNQINL